MVRCAGEQGKYWEMRDRLFANPNSISQTAAQAAAVGLDSTRFASCLGSNKYAADIRADMAQAEAAGVQGTPSFFLATMDPASGKLRGLAFLTGAQPFAKFQEKIESALAQQ